MRTDREPTTEKPTRRQRMRSAWRAIPLGERRRAALWGALVATLALAGLGVADRLHDTNPGISGTPSARADQLDEQAFGQSTGGLVYLKGPPAALDVQGPEVAAQLRALPQVQVLDPWSTQSRQLRPAPNKAVLLVNVLGGYEHATRVSDPQIRGVVDRLALPPVEGHVTGFFDVGHAIHDESTKAIEKAEIIAAPALLIVLLLVLGSPIAAGLPLMLGGAVVAGSYGGLSIVNEFVDLDATSANLATMMGLALGVDYALLMVTRFREELAAGASVPAAAAATTAAAGRTVRVAGVILMLTMLAALTLAPGTLLVSAATGVVIAALLSVAGAALAMPAMLRLVGTNVNRLMLLSPAAQSTRWGALALRFSRRPVLATALIGGLIILMAAPALGMHTHPPTPQVLPENSKPRQDYDAVAGDLRGAWAAPYEVIAVSHDGPLTDRQRLAKFAAFERQIARDPRVRTVLGPGQILTKTAAIARAPRQLRDARRSLANGQRGLARLAHGTDRAASGVHQLLAGLRRAASGAGSLNGGAGQVDAGASRLEAGLAQADGGVQRLTRGLSALAAGADRLRAGQGKARAGAARLAAGTRRAQRALTAALPEIDRLAGALREGSDGLTSLRKPVGIAEAQLAEALKRLDAMLPSSKVDPQYAALYRAVATADGAVTGRDPRNGQLVDPNYPGLDSALRTAASQAAQAVAAVQTARGRLGRLARGLHRVAAGLGSLRAGLDRLGAGAGRLRAGARRASAGGEQLSSGAQQLSAGAHRLHAALGQLTAGSSRLATGLDGASRRAQPLANGMTRLRDGSARANRQALRLGRPLRQSERLALLLSSGYATAAAIDSAKPDQRAQAAQAINVDRGSTALRIFVFQKDPRRLVLADTLRAAAKRLARATNSDVRVGGPGTLLLDFDRSVRARLPLLMLAMSLLTYLALVVVLRSLLLPLVAVALNLATVVAALGVLGLCFSHTTILGGTGVVDDIMLITVFAVVFALSIDYEVFLLTRVREGWLATNSTEDSISHGLKHTGGVITGAAAIMCAVFAAFSLSELINLRQLGVGLMVAVILDATLVRLVLLPAALRMLGARAWHLPRWLRWLPEVNVEGGPAAPVMALHTARFEHDPAPQPADAGA